MKEFRIITFVIFTIFMLLAILDLIMCLKAKYYDKNAVTSNQHLQLCFMKIVIALIPITWYFIAHQMDIGAFDFMN